MRALQQKPDPLCSSTVLPAPSIGLLECPLWLSLAYRGHVWHPWRNSSSLPATRESPDQDEEYARQVVADIS